LECYVYTYIFVVNKTVKVEDKRTIHTYKVSEKTYDKAMKVCKRRKQYLSNIIESIVEAVADDKDIITHHFPDTEDALVDVGVISQRA
jgi:asparagine synthetase A